LNIADLETGIYFLQVRTANDTYIEKLVKH
jgi:hypothetical protein